MARTKTKKRTKEEIAAYKRELHKNMLDEIEKTLSEAASCSGNMDKWLRFILNFKKYSTNNMAILYSRFENPLTQTYNQWEAVGAHVLEGEKATKLLAPYKKKKFLRGSEIVDLKNATEQEKKDIEAGVIETFVPHWYDDFCVFDVSQTTFANMSREELLLKLDIPKKEKKKSLEELMTRTGLEREEMIDMISEAVKRMSLAYADMPRIRTIYEYALRFVVDSNLGLEENLSKYNLGSIAKEEIPVIKKIMDQLLSDGQDLIDMMWSL